MLSFLTLSKIIQNFEGQFSTGFPKLFLKGHLSRKKAMAPLNKITKK